MRRAFIADDGCGLLTADYSQIELRVLAHLAEDPGLIDAFERGADVHTTTAAKVFGVDEADVDAFQRRFAKVVNYGLAYGMEAYGLGQRLDIPTDQAREILDSYFEAFPNVQDVHGRTVQRGEAARLHDDDLRPPPPDHRARRPTTSASARWGSAWRRTRRCRVRRPTSSSSRWSTSTARSTTRELASAHDPHRARRARARGAARRARPSAKPVVREVMESAAELRVPLVVDTRLRPELGRGEVAGLGESDRPSEPAGDDVHASLISRHRPHEPLPLVWCHGRDDRVGEVAVPLPGSTTTPHEHYGCASAWASARVRRAARR